ncbi:MAG: DEAD/DEAH box helicase, partial [Saprospiraceae bacterium]
NKTKEYTFVEQLNSLGFIENDSRFFFHDDTYFGVIRLLTQVKDKLEDIQTNLLTIEDKKIVLSTSKEEMKSTLEGDWFDVHGHIILEERKISFSQLMPYIKSKNPYFPLDQNQFFIIPEEMMVKLSDLALFGKEDNGKFKIHKSQHGLIEPKELRMADLHKDVLVDAQAINYVPSKHLKATLRPYQHFGVQWMLAHRQNQLGCLLADDMGLGKTLQIIALLAHVKDHLKNVLPTGNNAVQLDLFLVQERIYQPVRALIILPASLVFNWQSELYKFAPFLHTTIYTGINRRNLHATLSTFDVVLTTYKTAQMDIEVLKKHRFEYVILDESQNIKNKDSKTFKVLNTLRTNHRISLSGTPIENSLRELWAQMQFINPEVLGTFSFFEKNFLIPIQKNVDEGKKTTLKDLISPFLLRRTKYQVAPELPEITRQVHYSDMDEQQAKWFEREKSAIRNELLDHNGKTKVSRPQVLVSLLRLRQIANHPILVDRDYNGISGKMEDVKSALTTIYESKYKVLVFSAFTSVLKLLKEWCISEGVRFEMLTGENSTEERKNAVTAFQENPDISIFFISLKAGGTGLNLTAAEYIFILDPWWNPFIEMQAEARAHRIGQEKNVVVKKFISKNSIEEKILLLQEKKKAMAADFVDENVLNFDLNENDIQELLA